MKALAATAMLSLAGCAYWSVQHPTVENPVSAPEGWVAATTGKGGRISGGWLKDFNDPRLENLVNQAIAHNHNLAVSAARMREARLGAIADRAQLLPGLDTSGSASGSDVNNGAGSENYRLSLNAGWEPDLWGRLRKLSRAGSNNAFAAADDYQAARLSLAASTARAYYNLVSAKRQLTLAEEILESFEKNLRIIERNYKGTGEGALDIQFGRNNVASAKRSLEARKLDHDEASRTLELLLGHYPAAQIRATSGLPKLGKSVPAGIPAQLLERRPDLRAAKARLLASAERADAARLDLLPSISITGSSSNITSDFSKLLDLDNLVSSVAGRFSQSLFSGGELTSKARAAVERNRAELHRYAQSVLEAFREVESALAADRSLARQEVFLGEQLKQAVLAERQAERDYTEGVNLNILSVLEAQRRANNARASSIILRNQRIRNRIDLHLALGGDFVTGP